MISKEKYFYVCYFNMEKNNMKNNLLFCPNIHTVNTLGLYTICLEVITF